MTEKRFTYMIDRVFDLWGVYDNNEKVICLVRNTDAKDLCDLLNELHEENEELQHKLSQQEMEYATDCNRLAEEKEQLKSTINTLTHDNTKMKKVLNTTKKENEQIKHLIKEAYNNERTKLGQSVLKQLINNIEAI